MKSRELIDQQQKSPAFQRRRKLQKPWPPTKKNATQKNAEALRFWKYDFDRKKRSLEEEQAKKMKVGFSWWEIIWVKKF